MTSRRLRASARLTRRSGEARPSCSRRVSRVLFPARRHEGLPRRGVHQGAGDPDGAGGVLHVDDGPAVGRLQLHGRVGARGGGAADEQRHAQAGPLHLGGHHAHLLERGRDEPGEADEVRPLRHGRLQDLRPGHHDAQVDDLVVVAAEHDADDVLADVVDVALDGGHHDPAGRAAAGGGQRSRPPPSRHAPRARRARPR